MLGSVVSLGYLWGIFGVSLGYLWGIVGAERAAMPHIKYRYKGTIFSEYASFLSKK